MILEIKNVKKSYEKKQALKGVSFNAEGGHIYGLFGPNGSGKTTLIKIISNLLMRYEGEVLVCGKKTGIETKKLVSYLPDVNYLEDSWKIKECVNIFKKFYDDFDEQKALSLLERFKLNLNDTIKSLSKGNKEKVQLILVLSRNAKLFLFDEPIAGVDPASRQIVFDLIKELVPKDSAVIITTHLILDIEDVVDHVIFINNGNIFLNMAKEDLEREYNGKSVNEVFIDLFKEQMIYGGN